MRGTVVLLLIPITLLLGGCAPTPDDHGHAHGAGQGHGGPDDSWSVTAWGEHFALFVETDALVAGKPAASHVHVTLLDSFAPVRAGRATVALRDRAGAELRFAVDDVLRDGIFRVELRPLSAGEADLFFDIDAAGKSERIPGGRVRVGTADTAGGLVTPAWEPPGPQETGEPTSFLLEQQWRIPFATAFADEGSLRRSVKGSAVVRPPAGAEATITAPVDGIVLTGAWPYTGQAVKRGQRLLSIAATGSSERSLATRQADLSAIEARLAAAHSRAQRLESLLVKEAVSRRDVEDARALVSSLEAQREAVRSDLSMLSSGSGAPALELKAPFEGRVAEVHVSPGERVTAGAPLVRLLKPFPVWIKVALAPRDVEVARGSAVALVLSAGARTGHRVLPAEDVRLVAVAPEVDRTTGTVGVLLEAQRSIDVLRPGERLSAEILLREEESGVVLPATAVVDDAGVAVVYVQLAGESFVRREVTVRRRQADRVLVDGLAPGERLVTVGGAAIRRSEQLASGSVEGHVH